jgi:hypothetical protein
LSKLLLPNKTLIQIITKNFHFSVAEMVALKIWPMEVNFTFQKQLIETRKEYDTADLNYPGIQNTIRSRERETQKWEHQILAISNFNPRRASSTSAPKK